MGSHGVAYLTQRKFRETPRIPALVLSAPDNAPPGAPGWLPRPCRHGTADALLGLDVGREPAWKKLATDLAREGIESRYLERVRKRVDAEQELRSLQAEIAGEIARALGDTEEKLNLAMAELELRAHTLARLRAKGAEDAELAAAVERFNQQRAEAERRRRDLVIHREAAGFRRNQIIYESFPIPERERL
jgi:hypothetical protein